MSVQGSIKRGKIAGLRAKGFRDEEIAEKLGIDASTVSYHTDVIREKSRESENIIEELQNILEKELGI